MRQTGTFLESNENHIDVYQNGTLQIDNFERTTGSNVAIAVNGVLNCKAGDQIEFNTNSGGTSVTVQSTTTINFFAIERVGN